MNLLKKCIKGLFAQHVCVLKTLIFNFTAFPFPIAIKLPVWIYSDTYLSSIGNVKIETESPIYSGMIKIGKRNFFKGYKTNFSNAGTIIFQGKALILSGCQIQNSGEIRFQKDLHIGENVKILIVNCLHIGYCARIAFETIIMDSDFHSIVNIEKRIVKRSSQPVIIGDYCWIANRCIIKKGTILPSFSICASSSVLSNNYLSSSAFPLLAGNPAKEVSCGWRRIYNLESNQAINEYFIKNKNKPVYSVPPYLESWDHYCL